MSDNKVYSVNTLGAVVSDGHVTEINSKPYTKAEQIDFDIIREIMKLRQTVMDMETAKVFSLSIFDNITKRLNDIEKRQKDMDVTFLKVIELRGMRGTT